MPSAPEIPDGFRVEIDRAPEVADGYRGKRRPRHSRVSWVESRPGLTVAIWLSVLVWMGVASALQDGGIVRAALGLLVGGALVAASFSLGRIHQVLELRDGKLSVGWRWRKAQDNAGVRLEDISHVRAVSKRKKGGQGAAGWRVHATIDDEDVVLVQSVPGGNGAEYLARKIATWATEGSGEPVSVEVVPEWKS